MNESYINIIEQLKVLDIAISKKMFYLAKIHEIYKPPSPLQFKILGFLFENKEESICQKTLELRFNVSRATISGALLTMENNGIIIRTTSQTDAREKNVQLTDLSKKRFEEMKKMNKMVNEKLVENISRSDLNTFLSVLENMQKNIKEFKDGEENND